MIIEIPDSLKIKTILVDDLKKGWRNARDYSFCQPLGNSWYEEGKIPVLQVPSAVLPEAFNYVINTSHPDFKKIKHLDTAELIPDERLEELLKKYRK